MTMDTGCIEVVVGRRTSPFTRILRGLSIAGTALCILFAVRISLFLILGAVIFGILIWYFTQDINVDYEYVYVEKEIRIAKIINKEKRKELASYPLDDMEIIAPFASHRLDGYRERVKMIDYTSGREEDRNIRYGLVTGGQMLLLDLDEEYGAEILKQIRFFAPRKVFRD